MSEFDFAKCAGWSSPEAYFVYHDSRHIGYIVMHYNGWAVFSTSYDCKAQGFDDRADAADYCLASFNR